MKIRSQFAGFISMMVAPAPGEEAKALCYFLTFCAINSLVGLLLGS
jgi:hypothetical protein